MLPRNIDAKGRIARGFISAILLASAWLVHGHSRAFAVLATVSGLFVLFEAATGWCAMRACGYKTRF
ncbi:MAG: DUF2892 domain-containing protein [Verrucomicrobiae bacterium]|nr:DUF2892 domain-containing protein [Verrucomicrobiae bacterium]